MQAKEFDLRASAPTLPFFCATIIVFYMLPEGIDLIAEPLQRYMTAATTPDCAVVVAICFSLPARRFKPTLISDDRQCYIYTKQSFVI